MNVLSVIKEPTKSLRVVSTLVPVEHISSDRIQRLIDDMIPTMIASNGVGIAAPQVGVNERVIIVDTGKGGPQAFINPTIVSTSTRKVNSEEGCLSIPGVFGVVKRFKEVTLTAYTRDAHLVSINVKGFPAIIFQHEIDHLDGILFVDRAERMTGVQTAL